MISVMAQAKNNKKIYNNKSMYLLHKCKALSFNYRCRYNDYWKLLVMGMLSSKQSFLFSFQDVQVLKSGCIIIFLILVLGGRLLHTCRNYSRLPHSSFHSYPLTHWKLFKLSRNLLVDVYTLNLQSTLGERNTKDGFIPRTWHVYSFLLHEKYEPSTVLCIILFFSILG